MPVLIPLIAAGISVAAGVGAVTVGIAGLSAAASMVVGGLMIAGGVLSAAGAITGNKTLSKWGGVLSLAGGVGAIGGAIANQVAGQVATQATSAATNGAWDVLPEAAGSGGEAAASAAAPAAEAVPAVNAGGEVTPTPEAPVGGAPPEAPGVIADKMPAPVADQAPGVKPDIAGEPGSGVDGKFGTDQFAGQGEGPYKPLVQGSPTAPAVEAPSVTQAQGSGVDGKFGSDQFAGMGEKPEVTKPWYEQTGDKVGGVIKDMSGWMEKNKELTKIGGGIVQGSMSNASKQRLLKQQMDAEWEQEQRRRAQFNDSIHTLRVPTYVPPKG